MITGMERRSTNRTIGNAHKILVGIPEENRPLGRRSLTLEDNIKV